VSAFTSRFTAPVGSGHGNDNAALEGGVVSIQFNNLSDHA